MTQNSSPASRPNHRGNNRPVTYLDTLRWVFIAVALAGIAVTIYARLDDWKKGLR